MPAVVEEERENILIIGATGRTGLQCVRQLSQHPSKPAVHGFCPDASKLEPLDCRLYSTVIEGSARYTCDVQDALEETQATWIVVCIGDGDSIQKSDIRTRSATNIVRVLQQPAYKKVRTVVVSSIATTKKRSLRVGSQRHVVNDHVGQEAAFAQIRDRTTVVRATTLTDDHATGKLVHFGDKERKPSLRTDRADLAGFIVQEICGGTRPAGGRMVNVASSR